jgi:hypothetical protein
MKTVGGSPQHRVRTHAYLVDAAHDLFRIVRLTQISRTHGPQTCSFRRGIAKTSFGPVPDCCPRQITVKQLFRRCL